MRERIALVEEKMMFEFELEMLTVEIIELECNQVVHEKVEKRFCFLYSNPLSNASVWIKPGGGQFMLMYSAYRQSRVCYSDDTKVIRTSVLPVASPSTARMFVPRVIDTPYQLVVVTVAIALARAIPSCDSVRKQT